MKNQILIRYENEFDKEKLKRLAEKKGRSMNKQLIQLIKNFISKEERQHKELTN